MASMGTARFLLIMVVLCLVATLCEGRGGRGGGRGGSRGGRSRVRVRVGGSGSGSGGGNVGLIVGIIFGVIGGIILIVVVYVLCRVYCFNNSSGNSVKDNSSQDVNLDNTNASTDHPYDAAITTFDSTYNPNDTDNGVSPPSYDSAIDQKEGVPYYSSQPNEGPPEALYPAYPSETSYPPNPTSNPTAAFAYPSDEVKGSQY